MKNSLPIFLLGGLLCLGACKRHKPAAETPVLPIPVTEAIRADVPVVMEFVGQVNGNTNVTIQARADGFLKKKYFEAGGLVKKGQLLYLIDPDPLSTQVAQARASLASSRATLAEAESNYQRTRPLAEINAVSRSELDAAVAQLESARSSRAAAEAALRYAQIQLGYTRVYSPIDGIVGESQASVGEYVGPGTQNTVLTVVSQVDTVEVEFSVPDALYLQLRGLDTLPLETLPERDTLFRDIRLVLSDGTELPVRGWFDYVSREINPNTGTLMAHVKFLNPSLLLRPGQFARVKVLVGTRKGVVLVPQQAVTQIQGSAYVYRVGADDRVEYRPVKLGPTQDSMWIVDSGVSAGDRIVVEGLYKIRNGMRIDPVPYGRPRPYGERPATAPNTSSR